MKNKIDYFKNAIANTKENIDLYNCYITDPATSPEAIKQNRKALRAEKKLLQKYINELCQAAMDQALSQIDDNTPARQLRSCQAVVYETPDYYILKSYGTIIAAMDRKTEDVYDVLRVVYGYTPTSAKQIAKFDALTCYGGYKTSYNSTRYTAR